MQHTPFFTYEVGGYSVQVQNRVRICVVNKLTRFPGLALRQHFQLRASGAIMLPILRNCYGLRLNI